MDREPTSTDEAASSASTAGPSRRLIAAGLVIVVLLVAVAVLATRLVSDPSAPSARPAAPAPSPSPSTSLAVPAIYQRLVPSLVAIRGSHDLGTGVIVSDAGAILTADHVVAGTKSITVTFADGTVASAAVAAADKKTDVATLVPGKLPKVVVPAQLGGGADIGAAVVAIGNPLGLTDSVSTGVISGLNRTAATDTGQRSGLIQFDAAVNPGSSGGPLLDVRGMVIGIVVALAVPDGKDAFAGIGFAVPIGAALGGGSSNGQGKGPQI
jgi:S1-C subfamily serine protease